MTDTSQYAIDPGEMITPVQRGERLLTQWHLAAASSLRRADDASRDPTPYHHATSVQVDVGPAQCQ